MFGSDSQPWFPSASTFTHKDYYLFAPQMPLIHEVSAPRKHISDEFTLFQFLGQS